MGQDRKTHQRAQRPELRFKATTKSMRFCGWEWLGCCTDRKTFCVCSFGPKVTVRGRGIKKKNIPKGRKEGSHFHRDQTENLTPKSSLGLENPLKMTQLIQLDVKFDPNSRDLPQSFVCFVWQSIQVTPD